MQSLQESKIDSEVDDLVKNFKSKLKIKEDKEHKESLERKKIRAEKRANDAAYDSSDTEDDDEEYKHLTTEEKEAAKKKDKEDFEKRIVENMKIKFTYQKLVDGLK